MCVAHTKRLARTKQESPASASETGGGAHTHTPGRPGCWHGRTACVPTASQTPPCRFATKGLGSKARASCVRARLARSPPATHASAPHGAMRLASRGGLGWQAQGLPLKTYLRGQSEHALACGAVRLAVRTQARVACTSRGLGRGGPPCRASVQAGRRVGQGRSDEC